jgi:hypothetical protein
MILASVIRMARLVTPVMETQKGGSIVNITTYASFEPSLWFPASCTYRAAVSAFTKLYSDRYGPQNIRMNCLAPGFTDSLDVAKYAELAALKRIGTVQEQAKAAAFLLTDESSYVTGQTLRVDGGLTRSATLLQVQADLLQCPVEVYPSPHATALGVAAFAARGAGLSDSPSHFTPSQVVEPAIAGAAASERIAAWQAVAGATLALTPGNA